MGGPLVSGAMLSSKLSFMAPVRGQHERRPSVLAAERAGEAGRVEPDAFEHLAAFADPTRLSPRGRTPVQMAPSRRCRSDRGRRRPPYAAVREASVGGDVERGRPPGEGLRDHQRRVVGRDGHLVGNAIASATRRTDRSWVTSAIDPGWVAFARVDAGWLAPSTVRAGRRQRAGSGLCAASRAVRSGVGCSARSTAPSSCRASERISSEAARLCAANQSSPRGPDSTRRQ
jgi:hypothetical protein